MVQASSFVVLTAIAFGAVSSVSAIPVLPASANVVKPVARVGTVKPQAALLNQQPSRPGSVGAGAQRLGDQAKPERNGVPASVENSIKSQNEAIDKMKQADARLDKQKAEGFEVKFKADEAAYKAYEAEAQRLEPTTGRPQKPVQKAPRALPKAPTTPPTTPPVVARPVANSKVAVPPANRPVVNAANTNSKPSPQQQLASQRTALQNEKQKFANQDNAEAKKYQAEADAYRAEAQRLEPAQKKPAQPKPQTYQQDIAAQNAGLQNLENKFASEDRTRVNQLKSETTAFTNQANQFTTTPGPRDFEDEDESFAREWEEFVTREWAALEELD